MARIFEFSQWFSLDADTSALECELELAGMVDYRMARRRHRTTKTCPTRSQYCTLSESLQEHKRPWRERIRQRFREGQEGSWISKLNAIDGDDRDENNLCGW